MKDFLAMGGYGAFIWSAYGLAALAIGGLVAASLLARVRVRRALAARGLDRRH
jgi:heme exporter protein D